MRFLRLAYTFRPIDSNAFRVLCFLVLLSGLLSTTASAQQDFSSSTVTLPEAPLPAQTPGSSQTAPNPSAAQAPGMHQPTGSGNISGTILDSNGNVVQGATVTLIGPKGMVRTSTSGGDGQYAFPSLAANVYRIRATGPGMNTVTTAQIPLGAGEVRIVPAIRMAVSGGVTSVVVSGDKVELSQEQVQIAVQQRVFAVIPNFYTSYDWDAPPMLPKQKMELGMRSVLDPVSFLAVAGVAGAEQYENIFPAYGPGIAGYGKRYGAAFANHVAGDMLGRAVYPSIFKQDPRYFYKGSGGFASRALYAISSAVIARSDSGHWQPNYSGVLGNLSAGAISNIYYPDSDRGASLVFYNGLAETGADAVTNLIREFLLKGVTSHVPKSANGKP